MDLYSRYLQKLFLPIIIFTALITIFFIYQIQFIRIENQPEKFGLPADDVARIEYENYQQLFGYDEFLIVAIESDSVLTRYTFEVINCLTNELRLLNGVDSVLSLSNIGYPSWTIDNIPTFNLTSFYDYYLQSGKNINKILEISNTTDLIRGKLTSNDFKSTLIFIYLDERFKTNLESSEELKELKLTIEYIFAQFKRKSLKFHLAGSKLLDLELQKILTKDIKLFILLSVILSIIILYVLLRNWKAVVLSFTTAILAVVWSVGAISLSGIPVSLALSMIIPIILMSSIEYSIHYLFFIFNKEHGGNNNKTVFNQMLTYYLKPNLLSGITTSIGFASLIFSGLEAIREVGIFISSGILFSVILNNVFLLTILKFLLKSKKMKTIFFKSPATYICNSAQRIVLSHSGKIIFASLVIFILSVIGIFRLKSDTNHLLYVDEETNLRKAYSFIDENFMGTLPIEIIIRTPNAALTKILDKVDSLKRDLNNYNSFGSIISAADYLEYTLENSPISLSSLISQRELSYGLSKSNYLKNWIKQSEDTLYYRINCIVRVQGSYELEILLKKIYNTISNYFTENEYSLTGLVHYLVRLNSYIIENFVYSFIVAFSIVFMVLFLLSSSIKLGILVVASNILPIIGVIALMGWFYIALDVSTVMIACISIGITVNDTIFIIYRLKRSLREGDSIQDAIAHSFNTVGSPIIITTIVLSIGFFVMIPSGFIPTRLFGLLSGVIIILALISDLLILPALINYYKIHLFPK